MTTILQHPLWPAIRPFVEIETYARDGGHRDPRHRLEVHPPPELRALFLAVSVPCVRCGRIIHPMRARQGATRGGLYLAVACELAAGYGCARGREASAEYRRIIADCTRPPEEAPRLALALE